MYLKHISLSNFKSYQDIQFAFTEKVNCVVGPNGSGKTNILDAIHYLSFCKSYFSSQDLFSINFNSDYFSIHGEFINQKTDNTFKVACIYKNGRKTVKVNNKEYERLSDHIGLLPLIMVSPYDNDIINEGSDLRRKFFDMIISQFDKEYLQQLIAYQKIILQRNIFLKQYFSSPLPEHSLLEIYNQQLIPLGNYIFEARKQFINAILSDFQDYYHYLSSGSEIVNICYDSQLAQTPFYEGLIKNQAQDFKTGFSNFGIHKDDFHFFIDEKPVKRFGSQGQQKSVALALKLSHYKYIISKRELKPILLLDDIFDKLDNNRIAQLLNLVNKQHFGQVFITDTDEKRLKEILDFHKIENEIFLI